MVVGSGHGVVNSDDQYQHMNDSGEEPVHQLFPILFLCVDLSWENPEEEEVGEETDTYI